MVARGHVREDNSNIVVVGDGASVEFEVNIGLRLGSDLSRLLFIAVPYLISRKTVMKDAMKKLPYAEDLAMVANCKQELQETLEEWNGLFTRHGQKHSLGKTEVIHTGQQLEGRAGHRTEGEETA